MLGISKREQGFISGGNIVVTRAVGHLLETASPEAYGEQYGRPWRADVLPVLPEAWKMVVKEQTKSQFTVISKLLKRPLRWSSPPMPTAREKLSRVSCWNTATTVARCAGSGYQPRMRPV